MPASRWWIFPSRIVQHQIESVETVTNIARLILPGVHAGDLGANDLEFSLDLHPEYLHRRVEACMQNMAEQLDGRGVRIAMGTVTTAAERRKYRELGVTTFQAAL